MKKLLALLLLMAFSCHQATDNLKPDEAKPTDEHFISLEQAMQIAANPQNNPNGRGSSTAKKIKSQLTIDDADDKAKKTKDQPVFYIINYEEGGYKIISADDRLESVLADVGGGKGLDKNSKLPSGLLLWMQSTKEQIQNIRKAKLTKSAKKNGRAARVLVANRDPLLRTRWGQAGGRFTPGWPTFNHQIPYSCPNTDPAYLNGNALVGCVGVAVAQVVRYWGMNSPSFTTPYQYNWSAMPVDNQVIDSNSEVSDGWYATDEITRLMADAAREVHTNYGCDGSSAVGTTRVVTAFKQYFGYSSASYSSTYRPQDVVANLNSGQPVILGGYTNSFMWWGTGDGHSWVCDGYNSFMDDGAEYCYYDEYGYYTCYTPVYYRVELHMNWGWRGDHNGWFSSTYFGSDTSGRGMPYNFKCNLDELLDIHP